MPDDATDPNFTRPEAGIEIAPNVRVDSADLRFQFSRGSGPGGQNVNKVNTKAELRIALPTLASQLTGNAMQRLRLAAGSKITSRDELLLVSDEHRSQEQNRQETLARLRDLLIGAMREPKRRKKTKPSRGARERRLDGKRIRSKVKARRQGRGDQ